ncbi:HK97 gp10 family phage protein [Variovorax paradoxus]|nr:HK97 gp10 family phage protein [Variovorax paradoxus]
MTTFAVQLSEFAKKAGANADLVVKKVAIDILARVVMRSPVDTGRFRGNWQLTVGAPASGNLATEDKGGASTVNAGTAALASFQVGPTIFITNNLPYGPRLEYEGYSKQAPSGMVRVTVSEFEGLIRKAIGEVNA